LRNNTAAKEIWVEETQRCVTMQKEQTVLAPRRACIGIAHGISTEGSSCLGKEGVGVGKREREEPGEETARELVSIEIGNVS